jgi:hypothetical protein
VPTDEPDDAVRQADREPDLPTSLVPRWLALLVLAALLAAAGSSVCALLAP